MPGISRHQPSQSPPFLSEGFDAREQAFSPPIAAAPNPSGPCRTMAYLHGFLCDVLPSHSRCWRWRPAGSSAGSLSNIPPA